MSLHVMDADDGNIEGIRECFGEAHADEQGANEPGAVRDRDRVDVIATDTCIGERVLDHGHQRGDMRARRDLGHDAAEDPMYVLRQDDE